MHDTQRARYILVGSDGTRAAAATMEDLVVLLFATVGTVPSCRRLVVDALALETTSEWDPATERWRNRRAWNGAYAIEDHRGTPVPIGPIVDYLRSGPYPWDEHGRPVPRRRFRDGPIPRRRRGPRIRKSRGARWRWRLTVHAAFVDQCEDCGLAASGPHNRRSGPYFDFHRERHRHRDHNWKSHRRERWKA